ncbi:hypothetical protein T11_17101 [Trichinella zimbabwensis]|uniref:Uncharacterized protein n=1 Tax=Trichinella zimbabwensis TaxID=268475 RepID=A0A0V1HRR3_9BILA|nr:hypothetical protein T11_17101 [Trichinella zimbabwensis]
MLMSAEIRSRGEMSSLQAKRNLCKQILCNLADDQSPGLFAMAAVFLPCHHRFLFSMACRWRCYGVIDPDIKQAVLTFDRADSSKAA